MRLDHDWFDAPLPVNVEIGERSWLYSSFAFIHYRSARTCGVRIGSDSGVYNGTFFDLGPDGEVVVGDFCTLVGAVIATNGRVTIGDYAFVAHEVVVADSACAVPAPVEAAGSEPAVVIGENAWVGARAVLLAGARLGVGAILGAGAVLDTAVPDYAIAAGNPAHVVGWARPSSE